MRGYKTLNVQLAKFDLLEWNPQTACTICVISKPVTLSVPGY